MAEKVELFELDINTGEALKDLAESKKVVAELKEEIKKLEKAEGDNNIAIAEKTAKLKAEQKELRTNTTVTENLTTIRKANTGSIKQMRAQLVVTSIQWAKLSKDERLNTEGGKKLTAQKLKLTNALKKEEKATGDTRRNVGNYNETIGSSLGVMGQFVPAVGRASAAMSGLGKAMTVALGPIGLIIAAIALVVGALKAFFASSEEGQNSMKKLGATFSVVVDNIVDVLAELGEALTKPRETIEQMGTFFRETFGKLIVGIVEGAIAKLKLAFNNLGLAWQKLKDVFVDNSEGIIEAQEAIAENERDIAKAQQLREEGLNNIAKAYDLATEAAKAFIAEQEREIAIAQKLADRQASLDKQIRFSLVANAKDRQKIAEQRNKAAQKETFDTKERLKFLKAAVKLEGEVLKRNLSIAQQKLFIKAAQNELSNSTKEDLDEEAQLRANVFNVRKTNFEQTRKLETEISGLRKTLIAEEQALRDAAREEENAAFLEDIELRKQAIKDELEAARAAKELKDQLKEEEKEARALEFENELEAAEQEIFARLELQRQGLEAQRALEIEYAESIGAKTTDIEKKFANARKAINQAEFQAKLSLAADFANNIATIAGEGTAIGKAAAVASTTISTIQSAQASYTGMVQAIPGPVGIALGAVAAVAAGVAGALNVQKILAVKSGLPGDTSGGGGNISVSAPPQIRADAAEPELNAGIIARDTIDPATDLGAEPQNVLVVDDVTNSQGVEASIAVTSET